MLGPCPCCGGLTVEYLNCESVYTPRGGWSGDLRYRFECQRCGAGIFQIEHSDGLDRPDRGPLQVSFNPNDV